LTDGGEISKKTIMQYKVNNPVRESLYFTTISEMEKVVLMLDSIEYTKAYTFEHSALDEPKKFGRAVYTHQVLVKFDQDKHWKIMHLENQAKSDVQSKNVKGQRFKKPYPAMLQILE
jgi:hypothetical protein